MENVEKDPEETPEGPAAPATPASAGEQLGRKAAGMFKAARPRVRRLVDEARPRVEKAGFDALRFAREHEDEIRDSATKLVRGRLWGPLGPLVDAVARRASSGAAETQAAPSVTCPQCQSVNPPASRFCNQCGTGLSGPGESAVP